MLALAACSSLSAFLLADDPEPDFEADADDERLPPLAASPIVAKLTNSAAIRILIPGLAFISIPPTKVQDARLAGTAVGFKPWASLAGFAAGRRIAGADGMLDPDSGKDWREGE